MGARRWRTAVSYVVTLGVAGTVTGCSGGRDVEVTGSWLLVSGSTADGPLRIPAGSRVSLTFDDGEAGGKAPCNDYGSQYEVHGGRLDLTSDGGISTTLVGCEGADGELESAYLAALRDSETVARDADTLTLEGSEVVLEFRWLPPWPMSDVVGHTWWLESWSNAAGTDHQATWEPGRRPFLRLDLKGDNGGPITARSGCQTMAGRWIDSRTEPAITRGRFKGSCLHALTEQERTVGSVLSEPVVELLDGADGPQLVVRNAHGADATHLVYRR